MSGTHDKLTKSNVNVLRETGTVVFTDIVSYSKRSTVNQENLIAIFVDVFRSALQDAGVAFGEEAIGVPTGDGVALCLLDSRTNDTPVAALRFVRALTRHVHTHNMADADPSFRQNGWSPTTTAFFLRIGVSRGELLTYTDMNGNRNFAGRTPNDAARLMSVADPNQALFTPESRNYFREFHPSELRFFHELPDITIKDQRYGACQLWSEFLDGNIPKQFATGTSDSAPGAYPVPWIPFDHSDPEVRVVGVTGAEYDAVRGVCLSAFSKTLPRSTQHHRRRTRN